MSSRTLESRSGPRHILDPSRERRETKLAKLNSVEPIAQGPSNHYIGSLFSPGCQECPDIFHIGISKASIVQFFEIVQYGLPKGSLIIRNFGIFVFQMEGFRLHMIFYSSLLRTFFRLMT